MKIRLAFAFALLVSCTTSSSSQYLYSATGLQDSPIVQTVSPGLVRWHPDLASAIAAAQLSDRPILVFQMLGRLDEEFC